MMDINLEQPIKNLFDEEKQAQAERALELEHLEDREFQGTCRHD